MGGMGDQSGSPEFKQTVDLLLRELCFCEHEFSEFEDNMRVEGEQLDGDQIVGCSGVTSAVRNSPCPLHCLAIGRDGSLACQ